MAEVKVNVGSPFHKKYQESGMTKVLLDVYIYSGTKSTDRGTPKYTMEKEPIGSDDYVIFDLTDLVKDYLQPTLDLPLDSNKDYIKWVELHATIISDKPIANDITTITDEDTPVTIELSGDDPEFRPLTFTKVTDPSNGTLGPITSNRRIVYTPNSSFDGIDSFTFKANNGVQDSNDATVTILVKNVVSVVEYSFSISTYDTSNSVENAIYKYFNPVRYRQTSHNFRGGYSDENDELTFRIGMVGLQATITGTTTLVPSGYYCYSVITALIDPTFNFRFPNGPYELSDLPQTFRDIQRPFYDNTGALLHDYILVLRIQNGTITERYEFKEADLDVFDSRYLSYPELIELGFFD